MKKNLIICPACEAQGFINVLAELLPNGKIAIERFHCPDNTKRTIVSGTSFAINCGRCGETVFFRKEVESAYFYYGEQRVYRQEPSICPISPPALLLQKRG
jgi:hypothetical protein